MVEFPEKIWAIEKGHPSRYRVSCSVLEHGPDEATEYVRADLYAALEAQLAERVKVKPLEWTELSTGWIAHTSFHAYEVVKTDHGFMATYENMDFSWGTEDAMKAAAQADFDHRILSALEATPPAPKVTEEFKQYRRKQVAELRPWSPGECMDGVSVSGEDAKAGSPKLGDMIARNPKNHDDKWLVAAAYFADNFEPLPTLTAAQEAGKQ